MANGRSRRARAIVATSGWLVAATALAVSGAQAQQVVHGAAQDRALPWTLERVWAIGGADDDELVLSVFYAKDLEVTRDGRLAVIDRTQSRVLLYDLAGTNVGALGRQGMGPGELAGPINVAESPDGALHILDVEKNAVVVFGRDGQVRPEYRESVRLLASRFTDGGSVVGLRPRGRSREELVRLVGDTPTVLDSLELLPVRSTPPVCRLTDYPAEPVFAPRLLWAARGDRIVSATDGFAISVHDDGAGTRVLRRATARRRSSAALAKQHLGEGIPFQLVGMPPCIIPAEMILSVAEVASHLPAYAGLTIAADGRIWARRYVVRGEAGAADIYHPARGYEGTIALGAANPVGFLAPDLLISLEQDADEVPVIVAYRVRR
jgi:hypothetical protein